MQVYVEGTKKQARENIAKGEYVLAIEYNMFDVFRHNLSDCPRGTVIKFWTKRDPSGTPVAKSYGNVVMHKTGKLKIA